MIKKIRLMLEYNTYCIWLYNENDEIIDNDNPPEWNNDAELTEAFMAISDLYDTFFVDNEKEFKYIGCPDKETKARLQQLIDNAVTLLDKKNSGKYIIQNDIHID
ncbi:MAG: hypothetical protein K6E85_08310 [Lachnospiraceae bacterium]|nr:hypothetical protein [Lachnospiraceae bacterium]